MPQLTLTYQTETGDVVDELALRVLAATAAPDTSNIDAWWRQVLPVLLLLVRTVSPAIYQIALGYLRGLARENNARISIPDFEFPDLDMLRTSFTVTGPVAFKRVIGQGRSVDEAVQSLRTQLTGSTTRQALNVGRRLINDTANSNRQIVGWRRVTDGNPCYFCAVLASRGSVYRTQQTALFSDGDKYHDHCKCHAVPLFKTEEEPLSVQELYEFYTEATAGKSGAAALNAFRRAWNTRQGLTGVIGI
jgi:hypothetical protein